MTHIFSPALCCGSNFDEIGEMASKTWAEQELGDARSSRRLIKLAMRLAKSRTASILQTCRGWTEMRAASHLRRSNGKLG